jgi:hypothetical protein
MSLTKGQIRKLKGKLSRVNPDSEKAKRIRATLGIEEPTQVVETIPAPKPVPAPEPEPVETVSPAIEIVETVVVEPVPAAKPKRTYRRRKTKTTTKE